MPTNQILQPAGTQVTFPGRPVDLLLIDDGKTLVAKNMKDLVFIDAATGKVEQTLAHAAAAVDDGRAARRLQRRRAVAAATACSPPTRRTRSASPGGRADGKFAWDRPSRPEGRRPSAAPRTRPGMALQGDAHLWVCSVARQRTAAAQPRRPARWKPRVPVGVAPYMPVRRRREGVRQQLGRRPARRKDDPQANSSGTPVRIDPRTSVANHGSVSVLRPKDGDGGSRRRRSRVGLHPSGMAASHDGQFVYVANANSDTVCVIDTDDGRGRRDDRLQAGGPAALRQRLATPWP